MIEVLRSTHANFSPDLDAFFARIGYEGDRSPTFSTLSEIQRCHLRSVPFESLNCHIGLPISIDPVDIERKVVVDGRGGYCFELNNLLMHVLRKLGFSVIPLFGRVRYKYPIELATGNTHFILKVELDNTSWLVDVAFGSMVPLAPIDIFHEGEQLIGHETRRILPMDRGGYMHQFKLNGEWIDIVYFTLEESYPIDWEIANWFTSTNPFTLFNKHIVVSIVGADCRYNIMDKKFTTRNFDGSSEVMILNNEDELLKVINNFHNIKLPSGVVLNVPGDPW